MGRETRGDEAHSDARAASGQAPELDEHRVRLRGYEIWEREGKPHGRALDHWLRARWELGPAPDPKVELERLERELRPSSQSD